MTRCVCVSVCVSVSVREAGFDFQSICWVRTWQGGTGGILFAPPHTHTHSYARTHWWSSQMLTLYEARLLDCQHLSHTHAHTDTHTHTHLEEVPIYLGLVGGCHPSQWGYTCAAGEGEGEYWWIMLQVMRWVLMGTETRAARNLFICTLPSYNFLNNLVER